MLIYYIISSSSNNTLILSLISWVVNGLVLLLSNSTFKYLLVLFIMLIISSCFLVSVCLATFKLLILSFCFSIVPFNISIVFSCSLNLSYNLIKLSKLSLFCFPVSCLTYCKTAATAPIVVPEKRNVKLFICGSASLVSGGNTKL